MGVIDVLSGLSTAAGKGFAGYGEDQQIKVKDALAQAKAAQEAERDRVLNLIGMAGIDPTTQGRIAGARAQAEVQPHIDTAVGTEAGTAPLKVKAAVDTAKGVEPIHTAGANAVHDHAVANPGTNYTLKDETDPTTGQPIVKRFETHTGAISPAPEVLPKTPTGPGAQNKPQMDAAKANLESAKQTMDDFEAKLSRGEAQYGPWDATKGAIGSSEQSQTAKGILGPVESLVSNYAGASLRGDNAELANYLKAKKFVAEAILNTHKRPNQTQYEIEQELSGIGPRLDGWMSNEAKTQIAQSAGRRNRMWSEVFGGQPGGASPALGSREAAVAHLKAQGKSDAEINKTLGPP